MRNAVHSICTWFYSHHSNGSACCVRSTTGRYCFSRQSICLSVCLSVCPHGGSLWSQVPSPASGPRSFLWSTPASDHRSFSTASSPRARIRTEGTPPPGLIASWFINFELACEILMQKTSPLQILATKWNWLWWPVSDSNKTTHVL